MRDRNICTINTDWQGITLHIRYEANWLSMPESRTAHLQIEAVAPDRAPLPITETGYRSHFCSPEEVDSMGGPLGYALAWLDDEARNPQWKASELARRQLSLF